ncbi:MAG: MlaE family lipid ABC transporter permease subunit [Desulfovibrionaceae bacterium]|nr:MlaE family lipid ABC transporter permease subunit [Desulfovibrionaceae bacterium]
MSETFNWKRPEIKLSPAEGGQVLSISGELTILLLEEAEKELDAVISSAGGRLEFDLTEVGRIDSAGRMLLCDALKALENKGCRVEIRQNADFVLTTDDCKNIEAAEKKAVPAFYLRILNNLGKFICSKSMQVKEMIGFLGWVLTLLGKSAIRPWRVRWTPTVAHMDQVGLRAVPIVGLLTFLIGLVVMYMGAQQLARFGAGVFSINLLEVATFRELGPMLTAIVVAGRSGSAFTAQIGAMVSNEELSAMRVMGFEPMEFLVLPRVMALVFMLPVLTIISNFAGTMGGAVGAWMTLDMNFQNFIVQFQQAANLNNYLAGLIKAPFFALCIAIIGCYHGTKASGSAASVGTLTTQSVVESIFVVITLDAIFALLFSALGV